MEVEIFRVSGIVGRKFFGREFSMRRIIRKWKFLWKTPNFDVFVSKKLVDRKEDYTFVFNFVQKCSMTAIVAAILFTKRRLRRMFLDFVILHGRKDVRDALPKYFGDAKCDLDGGRSTPMYNYLWNAKIEIDGKKTEYTGVITATGKFVIFDMSFNYEYAQRNYSLGEINDYFVPR